MLTPVKGHDAIVIVGSSVLDVWIAEVVRDACARATPPVEVHAADRDASLDDLGRSDGAPRVFLVNHPGRPVLDAIEAGKIPVVGVLDDPVDSVRFTRLSQHCDLLAALRLQTSHACAHHLLLGNPAVLLVHRAFDGVAHDVVSLLIEHLGLVLAPAEQQAVLERLGGPVSEPWSLEAALRQHVPGYADLDRLAEAITADEAGLVRQTLSPLVLGAISADIGAITWPAKVFLFGDAPNTVAPPVADVTGAARIIYYGPYFHLPPGVWNVRLIVAFSIEARGTPFRLIFWCDHKPIAKVLVRPTDGGAFEGNFTMQHWTPEHNIEIQFMNDEGTIEGHIALGQITFTRIDR